MPVGGPTGRVVIPHDSPNQLPLLVSLCPASKGASPLDWAVPVGLALRIILRSRPVADTEKLSTASFLQPSAPALLPALLRSSLSVGKAAMQDQGEGNRKAS